MGGLSTYFDGVAAKVLSQVEANPGISNQHEFNGAGLLRPLLGEPEEKLYLTVRHVDMENLDEPKSLITQLTWYNARRGKPRAAEWRLYYLPELAPSLVPGGTLVIARRDDSYFCFTSAVGTPGEAALRRLFSLDGLDLQFQRLDEAQLEEAGVAVAERLILAEFGIAPDDEQPLVDAFFKKFGDVFPRGEDLSAFVRSNTYGLDPRSEPDDAIVTWARVELELFNAMETRVEQSAMDEATTLQEKLDVAMRVFQRRRSRAGKAFEYHLRALFDLHGITYSANPVTEGSEEPDFILPSIDRYRDPYWPNAWLLMLAAKQTLRDRWRQILREAERVDRKHLVTLDPNLTANQVREIDAVGIQLVVPASLHGTYATEISDYFWSVERFIEEARAIQNASAGWRPSIGPSY